MPRIPSLLTRSPARSMVRHAQEIALTLLLSLRFMSLVFEEVRNLCLGLAARGVNWQAQGGRGSLLMAGRLCVRLFANLFHRCVRANVQCMICGSQPLAVGEQGALHSWAGMQALQPLFFVPLLLVLL